MIQKISALLFLIIIFSCSNPKEEQKSEPVEEVYSSSDTILGFSGYYLSEAYLNSIIKYKSPKLSQEGIEESLIIIPDSTSKKTMLVYNFHEGNSDLTIVKNKNTYGLHSISNDSISELKYNIEILSDSKLKLGKKIFIKINPFAESDEPFNPKILEEILFKGKYKSDDGKLIELTNDGKITGLEEYLFYNPLIDYFDEGLQVDQVGFGKPDSAFEYFGFKFRDDQFLIYQLKCTEFDSLSNRCGVVDFGKLRYKLTRVN